MTPETTNEDLLCPVRFCDAEARVLDGELAAEYTTRYGPGDWTSTIPPEAFDPPGGCFLIVMDGSQVVAGGGFRWLTNGVCEVKRMWTRESHRRRGLATRILTALEDHARRAGYTALRLETGPAQPEAAAMYHSRGYRPIPAYGEYADALAFEHTLSGCTRGTRSGRAGKG